MASNGEKPGKYTVGELPSMTSKLAIGDREHSTNLIKGAGRRCSLISAWEGAECSITAF
ncbi:MAG: hypothetical protein ABSD49_03560 [Candidatus Bathyarchaeia archaeon]